MSKRTNKKKEIELGHDNEEQDSTNKTVDFGNELKAFEEGGVNVTS